MAAAVPRPGPTRSRPGLGVRFTRRILVAPGGVLHVGLVVF